VRDHTPDVIAASAQYANSMRKLFFYGSDNLVVGSSRKTVSDCSSVVKLSR